MIKDFSELNIEEKFLNISLERVTNIKEFRKPERLLCEYICSNILRNPIRCKQCSAHFCKPCIDKWLQSKKLCPKCLQDFIPRKVESILKEDLDDLLIYCVNKPNGCDKEIKYEFLYKHEDSECDYTISICKWCDFRAILKDVKLHEATCENKTMYCLGCESEVNHLQFQEHYIPCLEKSITTFRNKIYNKKIHFSKNIHHRNNNISLDGNLIARQTVNVYNKSGAVILKPKLKLNQCWSWKIRILKLSEWIGVGICDYKTIISKSCTLTDSEIENQDNGCIMISSNGITWSQYFKEDNFQQGIPFTLNQIIEIIFNPILSELFFRIENENKNLTIPNNNVPYFYPVVVLGSTGDAVEILSSKRLSK